MSPVSAGRKLPRYTSNAIEAQMMKLADYAFLLRDYGIALKSYRDAGLEFKSDKAWRHYALSQEMAALCIYLTDGSRRDMDEALEKATTSYIKARSSNGDRAARHATRAVLLQMDLLRKGGNKQQVRERVREVAFALVGQSTEESNLCAALLLEQAALCFSSMPSAKLRQYSFHLILAGYHYISCSQRRHAVRAYSSALGIYMSKGWTHIEDHIHFTLGRNCATLGRIETAIGFFLRLLRHSRQPQERQETFMKELSTILRANSQHSQLPNLPLPRFNQRSIKVILNDHMQVSRLAPSDVLCAAHPLWAPLVKPLLPPAEATSGNWLTGGNKSSTTAAPTSICVVGEWIYLEVDIENPMHLKLNITNLRLLCSLKLADGVTAEPGEDPFKVDAHEVELAAGGRRLARLGVCPNKEGELRIEGAGWTLNGVAHSSTKFELQGRRLNKTKAHRMGKMYSFDQSLIMPVIPPMPLLKAEIEGMPETMMLGQRHRAELVLTNVGRTPLSSLRLRLSQPAFCVVGEDAPSTSIEAAAEQAAAAVDGIGEPVLLLHQRTAVPPAPKKDWATLSLPLPNGELKPGQTARVPLWLRANSLGAHTLHYIFCYEPTSPSKMLKRRLCPVSQKVIVQPALAIRHFIRRGRGTTENPGFVLGLTLRNTSSGTRLCLSQLSCVSQSWQIKHLCKSAKRPEPLQPGEDFTIYLRVTRQEGVPMAPPPKPAPPAVAAKPSNEQPAAAEVTITHFELNFTGQGVVDSRDVPLLSFLEREKAPRVTTDTGNDENPYARKPKKGSEAEPKIDETFSIVLHYKDDSGAVVGQLQLVDLVPQPALLPPPPAPDKRSGKVRPRRPLKELDLSSRLPSMLALTLDCAKSSEHSFAASPLCTQPVFLRVVNSSSEIDVCFTFEVLGGPDRATNLTTASAPSGEPIWLGLTTLSREWLRPGEKKLLALTAGMWAVGKYTLDGFRVAVCAWRLAGEIETSSAEVVELEKPISCPPPPTRVLEIVDMSDISD